jgi:hypothetical protein
MGSTMEQGPLARTEELLVERIGPEIVIYDARTKQAHCLSPLATAVFEMSDGRRSLDELTIAAGSRVDEPVSRAELEQAIAELEQRDLLVAAANRNGVSRRHLIGRGARLGTAAFAATFVTTLSIPGAASAASCGNVCGNNGDCPNPSCPVCKKVTPNANDKTCNPP